MNCNNSKRSELRADKWLYCEWHDSKCLNEDPYYNRIDIRISKVAGYMEAKLSMVLLNSAEHEGIWGNATDPIKFENLRRDNDARII